MLCVPHVQHPRSGRADPGPRAGPGQGHVLLTRGSSAERLAQKLEAGTQAKPQPQGLPVPPLLGGPQTPQVLLFPPCVQTLPGPMPSALSLSHCPSPW